jgi:hypothetical protein
MLRGSRHPVCSNLCMALPEVLRRAARAALPRAALVAACALPGAAPALDRSQLAIIINSRDPLSVQIGEYYAARRQISFQNIIRVEFTPGAAVLSQAEFEAVKATVDAHTRPAVQA